MDIIVRNTDIPVQLTPEELADLWWSMNAQEQAEFFNRLGKITTKRSLESQMISVMSCFSSKDKGLEFLDNFKDCLTEE